MHRPPRPVGAALRLRSLGRAGAVGTVLAVAIIAEYLVALHVGWPVEQARALSFATLLTSQPVLVLSTRNPDRPLWDSGRPWTRTLTVVVVVIAAATIASVQLGPLAQLLQLAPFPTAAWAVVVAVAATTLWSEPLKRPAPT